MPALWFVMPVHGRIALAAICLRQLRRTCSSLASEGIAAAAVIVGEAAELRALNVHGLGFGFVIRGNEHLGRKFNDGIQLATDPEYNDRPVDYVVPIGSDDWVDYRLFVEPLPDPSTIVGFQTMSFVREDGGEISTVKLSYEGGAGVRIIPRALLEPLGYRPADEDRARGCDTSILRNLRALHRDQLQISHWHLHDRQIVDWKTPGEQLNQYASIVQIYQRIAVGDPFEELDGVYPRDSLEDMRCYYHALAERTAA